jgi:hypothetical protein
MMHLLLPLAGMTLAQQSATGCDTPDLREARALLGEIVGAC